MDRPVYDAIIVGAGMAGLTAAAYLSRQNLTVLVCERASKTGGLVGSFEHQGFTFDSGLRAIENSGIVFPMLKDLEIPLEVVTNPVAIGIGSELVRLMSVDSLKDYEALLSGLFPANTEEISRITARITEAMQHMDVLYGIDNPIFTGIPTDKKYLLNTLLPWLLRYQVAMRKIRKMSAPINLVLSGISSNQALIDMITQHFFRETPAFFALSYFQLYLDYSYPRGGTGKLVDSMNDYLRANGVEILLDTAITRVRPAQNLVETEAGLSYAYRKLIWAADQKAFYSAVETASLPEKKQRRETAKQADLVLKAHGGDSILSVYIGADLPVDYFALRSAAHTFYTPRLDGLSSLGLDSWREILREPDESRQKGELFAWLRRYLELTTFEISIPVMRDASLAPAGKTGLIISTLLDYALVRHASERGWYEELKAFCSDVICTVIDDSIYPGLREKVIFSICATPLTIERLSGNAEGAITGWAFTNARIPSASGFTKMAKAPLTPVPDVFQAGQWSFSPSGMPVSILTGKLAADEVLKSLGQKP